MSEFRNVAVGRPDTKELNNGVQTFPAVLFAGMMGFHREPMFEVPAADRAAYDRAPEVKF